MGCTSATSDPFSAQGADTAVERAETIGAAGDRGIDSDVLIKNYV